MTSVEEIRQHIEQATATREGRVAVIVGTCIRAALDLVDEQSAAVLEVMTERARKLQEPDAAPKHRYKLRAALIEYLEERRNAADSRERQLAEMITGGDLPG